ncbi:MAG: flagellar hook-associated protein FlgL [Gammaproteobacteria bacterium]
MRISTQQFFQLNMNSLQEHAERLSNTQLQLTRGEKLLAPADDPGVATRILGLEQRIASLQQYDRNLTQLESNLLTEETAVTQVHAVLDDARERLIDINNGVHSLADYQSFADDLTQMRDQLFSLANGKNASGEFMFAGTATGSQPFLRDASGAYIYQGNQQIREVPVAVNRTLAQGDTGYQLFVDIFNGNQGVSASVNPANSGTGVVGQVGPSQPGSYNGDHLRVRFTAPDSYDLINVTTATTVATAQPYTSGDSISFSGINITLEGQPATGDEFDFVASQRQTPFSMLDDLVNTLTATSSAPNDLAKLTNAVNRGLENIDAALEQSIGVRTRVGNRLQTLDTVRDANQAFDISYRTTLSELQDLDFTAAAARLADQQSALEIAQAAFVRVQGLSLFNFL